MTEDEYLNLINDSSISMVERKERLLEAVGALRSGISVGSLSHEARFILQALVENRVLDTRSEDGREFARKAGFSFGRLFS